MSRVSDAQASISEFSLELMSSATAGMALLVFHFHPKFTLTIALNEFDHGDIKLAPIFYSCLQN
jgi:hypothetical protein